MCPESGGQGGFGGGYGGGYGGGGYGGGAQKSCYVSQSPEPAFPEYDC